MHLHSCGSIAAVVSIVASLARADAAPAAGSSMGKAVQDRGALLLKVADSGIDIVRMPP